MIKISKLIFGKYFRDPSNKDQKYLTTNQFLESINSNLQKKLK